MVIVILGILSTISVGTFRSYFAKARDSERVSTVQNLAMMIKVDSGGSGDAYVYRYGDGTDCISETEVAGGATMTSPDCRSLADLLTENDYDMPDAKNGKNFYYCFLPGGEDGVVGHNDFLIVVGAEEDSAQNAEPIKNLSARAFVDGTVNGINALLDVGGGLDWDTDDSLPDPAGMDWVCEQICNDGSLGISGCPSGIVGKSCILLRLLLDWRRTFLEGIFGHILHTKNQDLVGSELCSGS
ncbi:MAG: hypothetical protein K9M51_03210 [Candidatus Gracilibacteria bacterium]|nr:hypothetical protein [Candidatus Gracilibacteria bacterium]